MTEIAIPPAGKAGKPPRKVSRLREALATAFTVAVFSLGTANPAAAQDIEGFLQNIVDILTGTPARLVAVAAVAILGLTFLTGRISMEKAAIVFIGIVIIFGAPQLVSMVAG